MNARPHKKQILFFNKETMTEIATTLSTFCTIKHMCILTVKLLTKNVSCLCQYTVYFWKSLGEEIIDKLNV